MEEALPQANGKFEAVNKQAMLAAIIESSVDAIISKTLGGYITSWNQAAERMFGYTENEVIGRHISLLIPPDKLDEEDMIIGRIRSGLRVEHFQTERLTKTGDIIPISLTISPIKDSDGRIIGASKIARDISDQVRAQQELQTHAHIQELLLSAGTLLSQNLELRSILQKVTDITTQLSGAEFGSFFYNMTDANGETYMLYTLSGVPKDHFKDFPMPRNTPLFQPTFSGEAIVRSDNIREDPRYGRNAPYNGMPDGHLPIISYLAVPVSSPSGTATLGGLFFGHSKPAMFREEHEKLVAGIAAQAGAAIENAKLYEEIRQLNTRKDEFIGVAGHELRTPLTTVKGYLQLLEDQMPEGLSKDFTVKAIRQVNKLNRLVADLLDVTKIQAGKLEYTMMPCFMLPLIRESLDTVGQMHTTHRIVAELPDEDIVVTADSTRIEQVLINFLTNAIKYSPDASEIGLSVMVKEARVIVSVQDWGMGIPKEHQAHIFNRYYRAHSDRIVSGMGIGLYIAKEIIDRHGGTIGVDSQEGVGSVFYFSLPLPE
ncbi:MAG TPA: PAS domain S-box protein [Puia sp.]|jgi:PAS domain S-box-containing protein|nr:PAS domain S-box protein [Puia sp.]